MKYIVILGDGMADFKVEELGEQTPLEAANKPYMDFLAKNGEVGMVRTVPEGMKPGSDTANLSVMGYAPQKYYTGRSPLEAASIGIKLNPKDVTYRCNLVTLSNEENYEDTTMVDYSADEISTAEADEIIKSLRPAFEKEGVEIYTGVSYRHCLVIRNANTGTELTPPHDISLKPVKGHLPTGENGELLYKLMKISREILKDHPVNQKRIAAGKRPATSAWFWGEGRKPALSDFYKEYGLKGSVISAVDLIKGIAKCANMESIDVEGATGNVDTNFKGKAVAAVEALKNGSDFVYIHMEAPDECGHRHEIENKVKAIELIDEEVVGRVLKEMEESGEEFSIMVLPDHPTPLALMTHISDPVPFVIYRSGKQGDHPAERYTEDEGRATGVFYSDGPSLLKHFLNIQEA